MQSRRYVHPEPGDTIESIAARELGDDPATARQLLGWNLHLAARLGPFGSFGSLLGSDIVFVEPPAP